MLFLIDENVPDGVARAIAARGHEVRLVREHLVAGTPDEVVAAAAADIDAIIVTSDRDFVRIIARRPADNYLRWRRLGRVLISCRATQMVSRVEVGGEVIRVER